MLAASACAPLFFRFFITLDGPVHVLHAAVLEQHWTTPRYVANGVAYNTGYIDVQLGDLLLMPLLWLFPPEMAHDLLAVIASLAVMVSVLLLLRAHGVRINAALCWVAPVIFNFLLITGFMHFLLGVACCLATVAWWKQHTGAPIARWSGFVIGGGIAWFTHRAAVPLLAIIMVPAILVEMLGTDGPRGSRMARARPLVIIALLAGLVIYLLASVLNNTSLAIPPKPKVYSELFLLRPFLILDRKAEQWPLLILGVLLLCSVIAGAIARWRMGRRWLSHDAWLALAVLFAVVPFIHESQKTRLLFVGERSQWLALLMLVLWLASLANGVRTTATRLIIVAAIATLPVQVFRLLQAERTLSTLREPHDRMLEAEKYLAPGSVVVPVVCETNWLLQHLSAYAAIRHNGIFLTRQDHLHFLFEAPPIQAIKSYVLRMSADRWWLPKHWASGKKPVVAHLFFIGGDKRERALWLDPWKKMIDRRYWLTFDNGYATVYTADPKGVKAD